MFSAAKMSLDKLVGTDTPSTSGYDASM